MLVTPASLKKRLRGALQSYQFWLVAAFLVLGAFLHYTSQIRAMPVSLFGATSHLTRHAVERVLLVLPTTYAALTFGLVGGLLTLLAASLIMLPRVLFVSPNPTDAFFEMVAVILVGALVSWLAEIQMREKKLRQRAITRLETVNAVSAIVSRSLELEQILNDALDKVLDVMGWEARAGIFLLDPETQDLRLKAHRGLSEEFIRRESAVSLGECLCGLVAQSGEVLFVEDDCHDGRHTRMKNMRPHAHLIVPLKSRDSVLGVMFLYPHGLRPPDSRSLEMLASIGNQIGIAVENARLYERERQGLEQARMSEEQLRFYVRHITGAQEDERKRIARELHDDTAQALLLLSRQLDALAAPETGLPRAVVATLQDLRGLTRDTLHGVRRFSQDLRSPVLNDLGLLPALEGLMTGLPEEDAMEATLEVLGDQRRLPSEIELTLFRITQEALRNIRKHSEASRAKVAVEFTEKGVRITISDDGKGFELPEGLANLAHTGKMGLIGMQERAQLLGGTLTLQSEPGQGTTVVVDVPA